VGRREEGEGERGENVWSRPVLSEGREAVPDGGKERWETAKFTVGAHYPGRGGAPIIGKKKDGDKGGRGGRKKPVFRTDCILTGCVGRGRGTCLESLQPLEPVPQEGKATTSLKIGRASISEFSLVESGREKMGWRKMLCERTPIER